MFPQRYLCTSLFGRRGVSTASGNRFIKLNDSAQSPPSWSNSSGDPASQSAVQRGKEYEDNTIHFLNALRFNIESCGQSGDKGIDFRGFWSLPNQATIPVVGQCKREKKKLSSKYVREFYGSMEKETANTLGIIVSASPWSDAALIQTTGCKRPLLLLQLNSQNQKLVQAVLNEEARALIPRLSLAKNYQSDITSEHEVSLIYRTDAE